MASVPSIGIFDSGVGGLSVLRAVRQLMPAQPVFYFGDQVHVPYGPRSLQEVRDFSQAATQFLLDKGAQLIVVACNTASAAALYPLRSMYPEVPFVGMEPAVKPAAEITQSGHVGVLATPATFQGKLYASVVERFASGVHLYQDTCTGLVAEIEAGRLDGPETRRILEDALRPMLAAGIDTVVLGCTHYPFVIPLIHQITGPQVRVIDPAPAVARHIRNLLAERGMLAEDAPTRAAVDFYTSGDPAAFSALLPLLLGEEGTVHGVSWRGMGIAVSGFC